MTHYISPISMGLGDLIVSLPAVQALIDAGHKTCLITRSELQEGLAERITGLTGAIKEEIFETMPLLDSDVYINMREHPLQKDYWWGSPMCDRVYPGYKINDFLKIICQDFGLKADFDMLKPLKFTERAEVQGSVVFLPGSAGPFKCWPKEHWLQLAAKLKENGIETVLLGQPDQSEAVKGLIDHMRWISTPKVTDSLDVLSSAQAAIGVDTGLTHLAVQQKIPTIAIYRSHPVYFRKYPHSFAVTARPCDARCVNASLTCTSNTLTTLTGFTYKTWTCQSPKEEVCLSHIRCEEVFAVAQSDSELFLKTDLTKIRNTACC